MSITMGELAGRGPVPRAWGSAAWVPRTIRLLAQDKAALKASAQAVLAWPTQRIVLLHNSVIEHDAQGALAEAFSIWD